ncbi:MAG: hypothetical protein H7833_21220, partial [Magnetococcus sp. DMHC-1]
GVNPTSSSVLVSISTSIMLEIWDKNRGYGKSLEPCGSFGAYKKRKSRFWRVRHRTKFFLEPPELAIGNIGVSQMTTATPKGGRVIEKTY